MLEDANLVISLVAVLNGEVIVLELDIKIGGDEFIADHLPDDAGLLVTVKFDDGVRYLDLAASPFSSCLEHGS